MRKVVIATVLLSASTALAADHKKPPPDDQAPKELIELRGRLYHTPRAESLADKPRFRALCDADGYPLVGNVRDKGIKLTVADFCAEVRKAEPSK